MKHRVKYIGSRTGLALTVLTLISCTNGAFAADSVLTGRWSRSDCQSKIHEEIEFTNSSFVRTSVFFRDNNCLIPVRMEQVTGSFSGLTVHPTIPNLFKVNGLSFYSVQWAALEQRAVDDYNTRRVCEYGNWALNVQHEVRDTSCAFSEQMGAPKFTHYVQKLFDGSTVAIKLGNEMTLGVSGLGGANFSQMAGQ